MAEEPVLDIRSLNKRFGDKHVLRDIEIALHPGDRLALSGPNGSGKTTLLRCIAGTLTPTSGTVAVAGWPSDTIAARAVTGAAVAHEQAFYQRLSGLKNLMFYAALRTRTDREARLLVESLVEELHLGAFVQDRVDRYSSGMLQQLGVARALMGEIRLLILDEPTRSLDSSAVATFWEAVERRPQTAVVIASHHLSDLERCPRRLDLS